jgi:cytoskeletal protein RodZ
MAKSQGSKKTARKPSSRRASYKKRKSQNQWLRWGIGAAALFVISVLVWTAVMRESEPPASAVRAYEEFSGVTGTSYDAGTTALRYPDPGQKGGGVQRKSP